MFPLTGKSDLSGHVSSFGSIAEVVKTSRRCIWGRNGLSNRRSYCGVGRSMLFLKGVCAVLGRVFINIEGGILLVLGGGVSVLRRI